MRITIKLMIMLALMSTSAFAANLFVPNQHPDIQAAVDAASPGDRILVDAGEYDGARITKWVKISGEGDQTVITHGPNELVGRRWFQYGFQIEAGGDKTSIRDLRIELSPDRVNFPPETPPEVELVQTGVFAVGVDKVEISNVKFIRLNGGVHFQYGDKWQITQNTVEGLHPTQARPTRAIGIRLVESSNSFIGFNTITHESLDDNGGKTFRGIGLDCLDCLEPSDNNKLIQNEVVINAPGARNNDGIRLFDRAADLGGATSLFNNKIIQNNVDSVDFVPPELIEYNVFE